MRILLLTEGSRGDIEPFVALSLGLLSAGFEVSICAGANFEAMITRAGVDFRALSVDYQQIMQSAEIGNLHGKNILSTFVRSWRNIKERFIPIIRQTLLESWQLAYDADVIIYHPKSLAGYHIAEKKGIPAFICLIAPFLASTKAFPMPLVPFKSCGSVLNKLSYKVSKALLLSYHDVINKWRKDELGLREKSFFDSYLQIGGRPIPIIHAVSPSVIPRPEDWPDSVIMAGYFFTDCEAGWTPPDELASFISGGSPPVYIGFGSMGYGDPQYLTRTVVQAVRQTGMRAILATGWGALGVPESADDIFCIDQAPHSWLFPQMSAVVHHGGAGSVAAGLRAGKPNIVCPFFADQPFWGRVVSGHNAGPEAIPIKNFNTETFSKSLKKALYDKSIISSAADIGKRIRSERGVENAVKFICDKIGR